jgi:hypothetical protein
VSGWYWAQDVCQYSISIARNRPCCSTSAVDTLPCALSHDILQELLHTSPTPVHHQPHAHATAAHPTPPNLRHPMHTHNHCVQVTIVLAQQATHAPHRSPSTQRARHNTLVHEGQSTKSWVLSALFSREAAAPYSQICFYLNEHHDRTLHLAGWHVLQAMLLKHPCGMPVHLKMAMMQEVHVWCLQLRMQPLKTR